MKPIGIELRLGGEREVESGLRRVGGAMDSVGTAASGLARAVGGVAGAFAGVVSIREFVQAADAVTSLQNQLKLATGSAQAAGTAYNELFAIAQRSRTGFVELGQTFASISTAAADLGVSQQRLLTVTEAIGNAVTISGTGAQAAQAALQQLGQGLASGTLRGEELNSVMEQTPRLAKALADGLGVTRGELRALGQQGAITAEQVIKALEAQSSVLQGEVKDATMTVGQAFTQLQNSAVMAVGEFDKATGATNSLAGTISTLAGVVGDLGGVIRDNEGAFKILGGTLAGAAVVAGAAGVVQSLGLISGAVAGLGTVLLANPAVLALLGIGAAVGGGIALVSAQSKTASGIEQAIARLQGENERSAAAMERALAGGRLAGADNIAKAIDARKDQIAKLRAELDSLGSAPAGAGGGRGSVNPQTVGAMALEQAAGEKELAAVRQKLYGVDKDYLPTLTKLHAQYQSGRLTLSEYQELVGKLAEANYKKEKSGAGAAAGLKEQQNAYEQLITSINVKIAQEREELAGGGALTDSQKLRIKLDQELASGKIKLSAAQKASLDTAIGALSIVEQEVAASKELAKAAQTRVDARAREADGIAAWMRAEEDAARQSLDSVRARVSGLLEEEAAVTLATSLNISLAEAIERVAIERMREKQAGFIEGSEGWQAIEREIAARKELLGLVSSKAQREDEARGWADMWQSVDRTAHDVFVNVLEGGQDAFKRLGNTLKASVLDVLYQMTVRKWIINIGTSVFGAGFGAAANAATGGGAGGALSTAGGIGNMASLASGIGSFTTAGMLPAGLATALTGSTSSLAMGLSGAWGAGGGMLSTLNAGASMLGSGSIMSGLGTLAGALGPIALGIAALAAIFGKKATPHAGAASTYSEAGGLVSGADIYRASGLADTRTYNAGVEQVTGNVAKAIGDTLNATARAFGKTAGYEITTAFADDKSKDGAWGSLMIRRGGESVIDWRDTQTSKWAPKEFADGEAGSKEYLAAIAKSTREALDAMDLPGWADDMLNALGETPSLEGLASTVESINAASSALATMGKNLVGFAGLTDEAISALVKASGGMAGLISSASTFYDAFYSDAEKKANVRRDVSDKLSAVGISGLDFDDPKAREKYRKMVEDSMARSNAQASARKALTDGILASASAGGKPLQELIGGSGGWGGMAGKDDPEARKRLEGVFADVNKLVASGKSPAEIEASVASLVKMNSEVLGLGEDAAATTAALLEASGAFASVTRSAEEVRAEQEKARATAFSALQRAVDAEKRLLDARIDVASTAVSELSGLFGLLHDNVRSLYGEVDSTAAMMAAQGSAFIAQALSVARSTGYLPEQDKLNDAISAARGGIGATQYATQFEEDRARLVLAGQLSELEGMAGEQLSTSERTLKELQAQSDQLDATLQFWRDQIELSQAGVDATLSVADAVASLQALMFPEADASAAAAGGASSSGASSGGGITWGGGTPESKYKVPINYDGSGVSYVGIGAAETERADKLYDLYHSYDGTGDLEGLLRDIKAAGGTLRDLTVLSGYYEKDWERAAATVGIPAFASGGVHAGGLRMVGERGWEIEATGPARIWNQQQIASAMGGGNSEMVAELRAMRAELAALRAASAATANNTAGLPQMADQFDTVTNGGNAMRAKALA